MIQLRALGTAEIDTGRSTLSPSQEIVFGAALYLILERGNRISRNGLASLLWPAVPERARAHRLRQTILQLKKLGLAVSADRDNLYLSGREVLCDIDSLSSSEGIEALDNRSLAFLPGYSPRFSEPLRDWLDSKRSAVHAAATRILLHELEHSRLQADWAKVEKTATKCLALDEYNETAVLARAEAAAMRGGKREAVSILDRYISEVGDNQSELRLPATLLRRRVVERIPDGPTLTNAEPPFVGREAQMELLTDSFAQARLGRGSATMLIGEPGIGKSRLSAELGRFAELQGAVVQCAACHRTDVDRPLSLFVDVVPRLRELPGALGCAPETFAALKRLTEFEQRPGGVAHPGDSEMFFQNVRSALFDLFDSLADERCLVMRIEDVQWLDNSSAKILTQMIEWCRSKRIFFLLNSRSTRDGFGAFAETAQRKIVLGPLTQSASTTLLRAIAPRGSHSSQGEFVDWCLRVAEGNPFFLQELARHWVETDGKHEAPPSVTKVLEERLSRLSAGALQVLQTCAVLADCSTIDRIEKVLGFEPHVLLAAIEELSQGGILASHSEQMDSPTDRLQPRHDFLSSAAIGRLAPLSLAFIHRRSADVLESEIADERMPTTVLWACAGHRHHAGDRERARSLTISCGEHLLEVGLAHEASLAFQRSMEYCLTDSQRLQLLPRLALASEQDGDWNITKHALSAAMQIHASQDPTHSRHNEYELRLLDVRRQTAHDFTTLLEETMICVEQPTASPKHRIGAAILAAKIATDFGRADYIDWMYEQVSPLLEAEDVSERARLELQIVSRTIRGDGPVSLEDLQRFADSTRLAEGELAYSRALLTCATVCRQTVRYREGLEFLSTAFQHATQTRLQARLLEILLSFVRLHIAADALNEASAALEEATKYPMSEGNTWVQDEIYYDEATLALERGDIRKAAMAFGSIGAPSSTFSVSRKGYYLALEIRLHLAEGRDPASLARLVAELEQTHVRMRGCGNQDFEAYALFLGLCALGNRERGRRLLTEYVNTYRRSKWPLTERLLRALE